MGVVQKNRGIVLGPTWLPTFTYLVDGAIKTVAGVHVLAKATFSPPLSMTLAPPPRAGIVLVILGTTTPSGVVGHGVNGGLQLTFRFESLPETPTTGGITLVSGKGEVFFWVVAGLHNVSFV